MLEDSQGALKDLEKVNVLEPNNAFTFKLHGHVKRILKDYQGAIDLDKVDVFEPNNAFTLKWCGDVKRTLKDYQGTLEDLDKADVFEPNNVFTLIFHAYTNWNLNNYQIALENLASPSFPPNPNTFGGATNSKSWRFQTHPNDRLYFNIMFLSCFIL